MFTGRVDGDKALIKKLEALGTKAVPVVAAVLKPEAQAEAKIVKANAPVGATKWLKRSVRVKRIKKKKRYTVGFRIVCIPPKKKQEVIRTSFGREVTIESGGRYYGFAPHYGVRRGRGKQAATRFMDSGTKYAESRLPAILSNIQRGVAAAWNNR